MAAAHDPAALIQWKAEPDLTTSAPWSNVIRVWIVEVDGKRLFIAGETQADGSELGQEIQAIVDSIQFE